MSWCNLVLTFDLAVVTLIFKILLDYTTESVRCKILIFDMNIG